MELTIQRTPAIIAVEINSIKNQTMTMILCNSIEIGNRLIEAKGMLGHGEWGKWLETSVNYSQRTANNLMRIAQEYGADQLALFGANAKSQALANLSYTQAVALLGVPEEEREKFVKENDVANMSTRELQQAIKERDDALFKLENVRHTVDQIAEERNKLREEKQQAEANHRTTDQVLRQTQADVKLLQDELIKVRKQAEAENERLEKLLDKAKNEGDTEEITKLEIALEDTKNDLESSNQKIADLERQLKEKPIDVPVVIEKVPDDVVKELAELREKAGIVDQAAIKFTVHFESLVKGFQDILIALENIKNPETHEKYKKAVSGLIGKMSERL